MFHPDSYGYRPGRSALDAVGACRRRCWKQPWVIDLDIRQFFDTVPHEQIMLAVQRHTTHRWVILYVRRWLAAPLQSPDGTLHARTRGTPQGSAISPLLANLFMHYAFDAWMARTRPYLRFERYCDDIIVHCASRNLAENVRDTIGRRLGTFGLALHPEKTRVVYCKDGSRPPRDGPRTFTFLGYTFQPRGVTTPDGQLRMGFVPAVSAQAMKAMAAVIRGWRLGRRTGMTFRQLATWINPIVTGWINYYGHFYKSWLINFLGRRINPHLVKWAQRKYKRLHQAPARARRRLARIANETPGLFVHWRHGALPAGAATGAV